MRDHLPDTPLFPQSCQPVTVRDGIGVERIEIMIVYHDVQIGLARQCHHIFDAREKRRVDCVGRGQPGMV